MTVPMRDAPSGGKLQSGNPGGRGGRWMRRDVREVLVQNFKDAIPKLAEMASGRVKVLLGFRDVPELARTFFEYEQRELYPDSIRVMTWEECPEDRKKMLIEVFTRLTGGKMTRATLAVEVGVSDIAKAIDIMGKYGLGTQNVMTDEEGNALPGVVVLPPLEMERVQASQRARRLSSGEEIIVEDGGLTYVEEDVTVGEEAAIGDKAPGPVVETVNPAVVEVIKARRKLNGKGGGNGER